MKWLLIVTAVYTLDGGTGRMQFTPHYSSQGHCVKAAAKAVKMLRYLGARSVKTECRVND